KRKEYRWNVELYKDHRLCLWELRIAFTDFHCGFCELGEKPAHLFVNFLTTPDEKLQSGERLLHSLRYGASSPDGRILNSSRDSSNLGEIKNSHFSRFGQLRNSAVQYPPHGGSHIPQSLVAEKLAE